MLAMNIWLFFFHFITVLDVGPIWHPPGTWLLTYIYTCVSQGWRSKMQHFPTVRKVLYNIQTYPYLPPPAAPWGLYEWATLSCGLHKVLLSVCNPNLVKIPGAAYEKSTDGWTMTDRWIDHMSLIWFICIWKLDAREWNNPNFRSLSY